MIADTGYPVIDRRLPAVAIGIYGAKEPPRLLPKDVSMAPLIDHAVPPRRNAGLSPVMAG
ncbi:hypothetical protein [Actinoplanes cyaneus]|uniref:hypothetical protein n=1 Tax=Actinoplanes cyaneus TaxID=52696 RepID=UPI001941AAAB|nr:hypothetical protein [Actinoplanes cyaneus]